MANFNKLYLLAQKKLFNTQWHQKIVKSYPGIFFIFVLILMGVVSMLFWYQKTRSEPSKTVSLLNARRLPILDETKTYVLVGDNLDQIRVADEKGCDNQEKCRFAGIIKKDKTGLNREDFAGKYVQLKGQAIRDLDSGQYEYEITGIQEIPDQNQYRLFCSQLNQQVCWDKSSVYLTPPECKEYAECPEIPPISSWEEYTTALFSFAVPQQVSHVAESEVELNTLYAADYCFSVSYAQDADISESSFPHIMKLLVTNTDLQQLPVSSSVKISEGDIDGSEAFSTFTRLPDEMWAGQQWKVYEYGFSYEMHSSTRIFYAKIDDTHWELNVNYGGTCDTKLPFQVLSTFKFR